MTPEKSDNTSALPRSSVINSAAYCNGVRVAIVPIPDLGDAWRHSDRFFWVGLYEPSEQLLAHIQQAFGLHELAIEDAHRAHQRPKLEVYDDSMFVVLRTARLCEEGERRIEFGETHVFVGPRYVVTVRHGSLTVACRPAHPLRGLSPTVGQGRGLCTPCAHGLYRRSVFSDPRRTPSRIG